MATLQSSPSTSLSSDPLFSLDERGEPEINRHSTVEWIESINDDGQSVMERITNKMVPGLNPTLESIRTTMDNNVAPAFNSMQEAANGAVDATHSLISLIDHLKSILSVVPTLEKYTRIIADALCLLYEFIVAWMQKVYLSLPALIYRFFSLFNLPEKIISTIVMRLTIIFVPTESNQVREIHNAQGDGVQILQQLSSIVGMAFLSRQPSKLELASINEKLKFSSMLRGEAKAMESVLMCFVRELPEICKAWAARVMPTKWWYSLFAPGSQYYQWMCEVETLETADARDRAAYDLDIQAKIRRLHDEGKALIKECASAPSYSKVFALISKKLELIDELYMLVDLSGTARMNRPVPFCAYLTGAPGKGKTFLMAVLPAILARAPANTPNLSYTRNPGMDFCDGYTGQFAWCYDDFYAVRGQGPTSEFEEFIALVSNQPKQLNMARLEDKGAAFRSRVILMTSNTDFPRGNEVNEPVAVYRRRHVMYRIDIAEEYQTATGELDVGRVPADNSHYRIRKHQNPSSPNATYGPQMTYQQFIADIRQSYDTHVERQRISMERTEAMVAEAVGVHNAQGELSEALEKSGRQVALEILGACVAGVVVARIPEWYRELTGLLTDEEKLTVKGWVPVVLTCVGVASSVVAAAWIWNRVIKTTRTHEEMKGMRERIERIFNAQGDDKVVTMEQVRAVKDIVLSTFGTTIPHEVLIGEIDKIVEKYHVVQGAYNGPKGNRMMRPMVVRAPHVAEAAVDENALAVADKIITSVVNVRMGVVNMQGIFLAGRVLLAPTHFFRNHQGEEHVRGEEIEINAAGTIFREFYEPSRNIKMGDDISIYECGANVKTFKDIRKHFLTDRDLNNKQRVDGWMFTVRKGVPTVMVTRFQRMDYERRVIQDPYIHCTTEYYDANPQLAYVIREANGWQYEAATRPGDCGAVLIANEPSYARKILGLHVAGATGSKEATGHIVTQEMINEAFRHLSVPIIAAEPRGDIANEETALVHNSQGNFSHYGRLLRRIFVSSKTKLMPSLIHGKIFDPITGPSVLSPNDPRLKVKVSPLLQGVEKYGNIAPILNPDTMKRISEHLTLLFEGWRETMPREVVSTHVAINGHPHYNFAEAIPMDTSAGFPFNQRPKVLKGKEDLFSGQPGERFINDRELQMMVDARWQNALCGRRYASLWIDNLKDERRKLEKIELGKTRVFVIPPVDFTIVFRRLCLSFLVNFYENALNFFSLVGIDPESSAWTKLYNKLRSKNNVGFAGDFSSWDGNLAPQMIMEVCEIINRWYNDAPEFQNARRVLFDEIVHTPQVAGSSVYFTHIGNPSGNPGTAPINTIIHRMYLMYAWIENMPPEFNSPAKYEEEVADVEYGDDGIVVPSIQVMDYFTPELVTQKLKEIGMTFTAATKDKDAQLEPVDSLTILKRGFHRGHKGRILPTMDTGTIRELTNWIRKSDFETPEKMTIDNCNESLRFAFFRGRSFFEELRDKILRALMTGKDRVHDWHYYYQQFYQEDKMERIHNAQSNVFRVNDNAKGIISLSQREEREDSGSKGPPAGNKILSAMAISDPEWSLPDLSKRRVWMQTYSWSTSDTFQHTYVNLNAPTEFLVNYLQTAPFERFLYWNGSMTINIRPNGTRFHAGRLIAFFVPFTDKSMAIDWHGANMAAAWSVPNVQIDASSSNVATLNIPFYNIRSAIFINGPKQASIDFTGSFFIQVLSPLTASSGTSPAIDFTVWVEFNEDQEFRIPVHSAAASRSVFTAEHGREIAKFGIHNAQGNSITTTNNVQNYGDIEGGAVPMNVTGDSIGNGNSATLPMDKPARPWNPQPFYRKGFQNLASTSGSELTTRMDIHTANLNLSIGEMFGTEEDEMVLKTIFTRPTYAETLIWNASATVGTALASRWIGPGASLFQDSSASQISMTEGTAFNLTGWEYASLPFAFWRGGVAIRLDVVATQMHTGRLFLALNYGAAPDSETAMRDATSQYGVEIDLSNECRTFEFKIPYNAPTPWLRMVRGPHNSTIEYTASWFVKYFMGSWSLRVLNALVAPDNVAPNVNIILSVAGADDYEVYYPGTFNENLCPYVAVRCSSIGPSRRRIHNAQTLPIDEEPEECEEEGVSGDTRIHNAQGDEAGTDAVPVPTATESMEEQKVTIAPLGARVAQAHSHFGPKASIKHIGELIKRYAPLTYAPITRDGSGSVANPTYYEPGPEPLSMSASELAGFTCIVPGGGGAQPTSSATYVFYIAIPVMPLFRNDTTIDDLATNGADTRHLMTYFGAMNRLWRGSMRFKIIWDGLKDYAGNALNISACGAVYIPGGTFVAPSLRMNWASIANHFSGNLAQSGQPNQVIADGSTIGFYGSNSSMAIDANTEQARYNDIEIPFTSIYNTLPVNNYLTSDYVDYEEISLGHVLFLSKFNYAGDDTSTTAIRAHGLGGWPVIYRAAGDDFRFGTYLGPPKILPINTMHQTVTSPGPPPTTVITGFPTPTDTWEIGVVQPTPPPLVVTRTASPANSDMTESMLSEALEEIKKKRIHNSQADIYAVPTPILDEFRVRTDAIACPVVGDWQVHQSRANVLAESGACFHLPYSIYRNVHAFRQVYSHVENMSVILRNTLLFAEMFWAYVESEEFLSPTAMSKALFNIQDKFDTNIHYSLRRLSDGNQQGMIIVTNMNKTHMVGDCHCFWRKIPPTMANIPFDVMKAWVFGRLFREVSDFLYRLSLGKDYGNQVGANEGRCDDCSTNLKWLNEISRNNTDEMVRDLLEEDPEHRGRIHNAQAGGNIREYIALIEEQFCAETEEMRGGYDARSLLNELCTKFGDAMQERFKKHAEGAWEAIVEYDSEFLPSILELSTIAASKRKASESTSIFVVTRLLADLKLEEQREKDKKEFPKGKPVDDITKAMESYHFEKAFHLENLRRLANSILASDEAWTNGGPDKPIGLSPLLARYGLQIQWDVQEKEVFEFPIWHMYISLTAIKYDSFDKQKEVLFIGGPDFAESHIYRFAGRATQARFDAYVREFLTQVLVKYQGLGGFLDKDRLKFHKQTQGY